MKGDKMGNYSPPLSDCESVFTGIKNSRNGYYLVLGVLPIPFKISVDE
jgi:hypothetical protein